MYHLVCGCVGDDAGKITDTVMIKHGDSDNDDDYGVRRLRYRLQESPVLSKRRVHFLDFMLDVHQRMHRCRQRGISGELMVSTVTDEILEEGWLLCFDEMQVTRLSR